MEVDAAPSDERQAELFKKLYAYRDNLNKYVTFAMTIQTMYKRDLGALVNLFEFYVHMERLDMALDICENDIFKSFNLLESPLFDAHLSIFAKQIIANLSIKSLSNTTSSNSASSSSSSSSKAEEFYFKLFAKFSAANQDRLVRLLLEKYQAKLMFIKLFCETSAGDNKNKQQQQQQQQQQHSLDIKNFYANLASCKDELFELRDLLLIHRKLIPEYGLFLIDGLLNTEKQLFANLLQRQQQQQQQQLPQQHQLIDPAILSIEWRSLNVMRRLCVVDLIPEFVYLISKLDNRHCYRWIEKSLEFFCKYVLNAIEIRHHHRQLPTTNDAIRSTMDISYTSVKLLHNSELRSSIDEATSADESSREIRLKLKGLDEFCVPAPTGAAAAAAAGSGVATTPFVNVYKLLDEIGKKLEWPTLVSTATATTTTTPAMFAALCIEDKLIHLFQLKAANVARGEKAASMSSLNKQISFYGISYFFNKLVEFHAISKSLFPNTSPSAAAGSASLLVMSPAIDDNDDDDDHNACSSGTAAIAETTTNSSVESLIVCLASCLRIWHKLNTNKEYLTIVTKCLSNSKLDSLACYKSFLADYFNNYVLTTSSDSARHINYSSLVDLSLKQKLPVLACLLRNETKSFDQFFAELVQVLDQLAAEKRSPSKQSPPPPSPPLPHLYTRLEISNSKFDLFEFSRSNLLKYFAKLIVDKILQLIGAKKTTIAQALAKSQPPHTDTFLGHLLVLIQFSWSHSPRAVAQSMRVYEEIVQVIEARETFEYRDFFAFVYNTQILQDVYMLTLQPSSSPPNARLCLGETSGEPLVSMLKQKVLNEINATRQDDTELIHKFCKQNESSLANLLNYFATFVAERSS